MLGAANVDQTFLVKLLKLTASCLVGQRAVDNPAQRVPSTMIFLIRRCAAKARGASLGNHAAVK